MKAEWEERRALEAEERMAAEERERLTKRARHTDLDLTTLAEDEEEADIVALSATFQTVSQNRGQDWDEDAAYQSEDEEDDNLVVELREKLQDLKVVSRAKVTQDRIYSAAYHPEKTKGIKLVSKTLTPLINPIDLIFFGGTQHPQVSNAC